MSGTIVKIKYESIPGKPVVTLEGASLDAKTIRRMCKGNPLFDGCEIKTFEGAVYIKVP